MRYYKIDENSIVSQVQPNFESGFKEDSTDKVICGMVDNLDGTFLVPQKSIAIAKEDAKLRIKIGFENELENGAFLSTITDLNVDNRRSGAKNDIANLDGQIFKNIYPIKWVCINGTFDLVDLNMANALKLEMIENGEAKYIKKWAKEIDISNATKVNVVEEINW